MVKTLIVANDYLPIIWPSVKKFIEMALEKGSGDMDINDVYGKIEEQTLLLLVPFEDDMPIAAVTLDITELPKKKKLGIVHCGGHDMDKWFEDAWNTAISIAKKVNSNTITLTGRKGWERIMKDRTSRTFLTWEYDL